jgi:two-component system sensor histidine kinase QseC
MTSIRRFLVIALLSAIVLINILAALYGYRSSVAKVEQLFDEQLENVASALAETPPGNYRTATGDNAVAFQVWQGQTLVASSSNAPADPITRFEPGFSDVEFGGIRRRAFAGFLPRSKRWVLVAERLDIRLAVTDRIVLNSVLPIVFSLPILGILIWLIVGRGLRPLDALAREMRIKRSDDLSAVPDLDPPLELAVLVSSINDLLHRLNTAFERERQFAADAAHTLRTPISVLKVQLHNLLRNAGEESPELRSLEAAVERMSHSVEQVLMLHRMTPDQFVANFEDVDLTGLARQVIAGLYPKLEMQQQEIELVGESAVISGDNSALETLLSNLIENASRYGGEGGAIRVTIERETTATVLTVEDNGPGIPIEQRERVFERFYRGQRDSGPAGTGIGLAIVKNIADIHDAVIRLDESQFESGLAISVAFRGKPPVQSR